MNQPVEYYFKEGCYIHEWLNSPEDPDMSIARVRVEPNTQTRLHALAATTERYTILSGQGLVTVGDQTWIVKEGEVVTITPSQPQKIGNEQDQDLIFLAICTPRFEEKNYQDLQDN